MIIRAKAPLRISFAGGGTDISPYLDEKGGVVLNATINKYAYTTVEVNSKPEVQIRSLDYNILVKYSLNDVLKFDGKLDLVKAVLKRLNDSSKCGLNITVHNDAPPGSGLGGSSTLVVSLIGAMLRLHRLALTDYEIANLAYKIEREDLELKGGKQDQFAATFGGFNFIEFGKDTTVVNSLRIAPDVVNELQYNLLLCYTGQTRHSDPIIEGQIRSYLDQKDDTISAMKRLKDIAKLQKNALLRKNVRDFGFLLHEAWEEKKKMTEKVSTPFIDELYEVACKSGALGGKISGAGQGGYMFFYCDERRKYHVAEELERQGAQVVDFEFEFHGLQTWRS